MKKISEVENKNVHVIFIYLSGARILLENMDADMVPFQPVKCAFQLKRYFQRPYFLLVHGPKPTVLYILYCSQIHCHRRGG
jgi:hypothetical protein